MRRIAPLCAGIALVLGAASCSSDSSSDSSSSSTAATTAGSPSTGSASTSSDATTGSASPGSDATTVTISVSSSDDDANRATVVSYTIQQATGLGYALDQDCVTKIVAQLSPTDAAVLAASTHDTEPDATAPELSAAGDALGESIVDCAQGSKDSALIAKAIDTILASPGGAQLDKACVAAIFAKLSDPQLQAVVDSATDSTDPRLQPIGASLFACLPASTSTTTP